MDKAKLLVIASSALLLVSCERETVTHVRLAKSADQAPSEPAMMQESDAPEPAGKAAEETEAPTGLQWDLPPGWTAKRETGMRYATLKPDGAGRVEVSVVVLPGPVGGELANVNRWRGQLGLPPLAPNDESQLAALSKPMSTDAGPLKLFDLVSDGQEKSRTLAAVLATESGNTWFIKMTGAADAVRARQADFLRLLSSLRFGASSETEKP